MFALGSTWGLRRTTIAAGVVGLAVSGLVATLVLTGPAAAEGEDYDGGWPELAGDTGRAAAGARAEDGDRKVIRLKAREVRDVGVDADGDGDFSRGDYFLFEEQLFNSGNRVGLSSVRCMASFRSFLCEGTVGRRNGNIEIASALFFNDDLIELSVTGGTGRFRDASGTMTVRERPGPNASLYIIRLVG